MEVSKSRTDLVNLMGVLVLFEEDKIGSDAMIFQDEEHGRVRMNIEYELLEIVRSSADCSCSRKAYVHENRKLIVDEEADSEGNAEAHAVVEGEAYVRVRAVEEAGAEADVDAADLDGMG